MSDKKNKFNFTPRKSLLNKNHKKANISFHKNNEVKKNIYQNDLRKIKSNKISDKYSKNNKELTDANSNSNDNKAISIDDNNDITQYLSKYLEDIQKDKQNSNENNINDEEKIDSEKINNNENKEKKNNSSEIKYLISTIEKEDIDFISTFLKLKGINSVKRKKDIYLSSKGNYINSKDIHKKTLKKEKEISNNIDSKNNKKQNSEKMLKDDDNKLIKEYSYKLEKNKKIKEKNNDKSKNKDNYKNKTINSKYNVKEITLNLEDSDKSKSYVKIYNNKKEREKSFDKKSNIKTSENKKLLNNNKKTKSCNKSPVINNFLKYKKLNIKSSKNTKCCLSKDDNNEEKSKSKNKKNNKKNLLKKKKWKKKK